MITTLGTAYISSDVGLGKTTVAAALILKLLENRTADRVDLTRGSRPTYKPTLILIPRDGMLSLFEDLTAFPDITAHQWYGQPGNAIADHAIGTSVEELIGKLNSSDKYEPVTARQVVVTTYTKFRTMATYIDKSAKGKGKAVDVQPHADEPDEDAGDEEETEEYEGKYQNLVCHVKGRFGIVVLDQAHKAKNPLTRTHVSISRTYPDQLLGLTSTPIMQSPADLLGLENASVTDWPELLPLLHPASFKAHLGYSTSHEKSVTSVEHAQQIVRPIMRFCFLRFYKGQDLSAFGLNEVVGGEIPRYKPLVMEFQYDSYQQRKQGKAFKLLMQDRVIGSNDPLYVGWNDHGHIHPGVHKELEQLASNCYSGKIVKKLGSISADDVHDLKNSLDGGFRYLQQAIAGRFPIYDDGKKRAEFIAGFHPKRGYLAGVLNEVLYERKGKLLVFVSAPFTHQILDTFLQCLGIQYVSINSSVEMHNRDKANEAFNDPENPTRGMTVNTNLGCAAFEAQRACHGDFFLKAIVQAAILGNIPTTLELVVDDAAEHLEDAAENREDAAEHREDATENREDAAENQQDAAAAQAEGNADAGDDVRKDHKAFLTRAMRLVIEAYGLSSSRLGWDRASCELLLAQQRERPNLTRADSVIEPEVDEAAGRSSNDPLVVDDDDDSDKLSGEQQDAEENPGGGPSTAPARGKRAASTELDIPAKRRAIGDEASASG
ncbi:hypothetical protein IWX50DRAFT_695681 [Phyllosticta citricarpa]|uniref:SNF2 N-terminal domain-containing protein n=1 Tax=Phyllosticta citricarpa TaxID=55181 RepID=A0ABR1M679_9PEZI